MIEVGTDSDADVGGSVESVRGGGYGTDVG